MKGKHKVHTEVSQRTHESSSLSGYELHSCDLYYYAWHFNFLLANSSLCRRNISLKPTSLCTATCSVLCLYYVNYEIHFLSVYLAAGRTHGIMLHVNIIFPRGQFTYVTVFISHLCNVIETLFVSLVNLSHSSEVGQLRSPRLFSARAGYTDFCQAGVGAFRPVTQPMLHWGLYYVLWKWEG